MSGFTGKACQRLSCTSDCNGRGECITMQKYASLKYNDLSEQYTYDTVWDAQKIQGCVCEYPYDGYDCSYRECPTGDDPLTTGQVNEIQIFKCVATGGSFVFFYEGEATATIQYGASASAVEAAIEAHSRIGDVSVTFSIDDDDSAVCMTGTSNVVQIEFLQNFGDINPLVPYVDDLASGGSITLSDNGDSTITDSTDTVYTSVQGTKESMYCSDRGLCDITTGSCSCYTTNGDTYASSDGYGEAGTRGDCGYPQTTTSTCPGEVACNGHGVCDDDDDDASYSCECSDGWMGGDCIQRVCPYGLSWFQYPSADEDSHDTLAECSNAGTCDRSSGECQCGEVFYGISCDYMACGGGAENACNGHGRCMSMYELALHSEVNGDATDYTYGADPNDATEWDAQRIYHCLCDDGYTGYDCTVRVCPDGDDPLTYGQYNEKQLLYCEANGGYFSLTFRQQTTGRINFNLTRAEFEEKLEELTSIDNIKVTYSYGDAACFSDSADDGIKNLVGIQFITEHGDVPDITATTTYLEDSTGDAGTGTIKIYTDGSSAPDWTGPPGNGFDKDGSGYLNRDEYRALFLYMGKEFANGPTFDTAISDFLTEYDADSDGEISTSELEDVPDVSIKGTTESEPCSNRGLCDRTTGECTCFNGFSSSDALGGMGTIPDCGHRIVDRTIALI